MAQGGRKNWEISRNPSRACIFRRRSIPVPPARAQPIGIPHGAGAAANNLKDIDVDIPLGVVTCVTGVSGSGKSSLVNEILYKALARSLNRARTKPGPHRGIQGLEQLDKVIQIDQSPIGRTPRSNPATYTGVFSLIREIFSQTPDARTRGYKPGRFSFNIKGGRCEACQGDGILRIEMHFLPDVYVPCEVCKGRRYNRETLEVKYKGKSIHDVLDMTVDEAVAFFDPIPRIAEKIRTIQSVGLGYIKLGQPSTTLSGGEAQRIKLATELSRRATGRTPTYWTSPPPPPHGRRAAAEWGDPPAGGCGQHPGHHRTQPDVIKTADYVIDMGPRGRRRSGDRHGTPEEVSAVKQPYRRFLARVLQQTNP